MKNSDTIPVACTLTTAELREREASLLAEFRSAVVETEELEDGFAFHLPSDAKWLGLLAELIAAERQCCRFLTFEIVARHNMGPLSVRVTGPVGTKEFVRSVFM